MALGRRSAPASRSLAPMTGESLLIILVVGVVAGWLAGQIVQGTGFGIAGDLIIEIDRGLYWRVAAARSVRAGLSFFSGGVSAVFVPDCPSLAEGSLVSSPGVIFAGGDSGGTSHPVAVSLSLSSEPHPARPPADMTSETSATRARARIDPSSALAVLVIIAWPIRSCAGKYFLYGPGERSRSELAPPSSPCCNQTERLTQDCENVLAVASANATVAPCWRAVRKIERLMTWFLPITGRVSATKSRPALRACKSCTSMSLSIALNLALIISC